MNILKRNGSEALFDKAKIVIAISKANEEVEPHERLPISRIEAIAGDIEEACAHLGYEVSVEDVQDMVEKQILDSNAFVLAKTYMRYRQEHNIARGKQELYKRLLAISEGDSEEATQENSNKNPMIASTQRDYMAGEVSRDVTTTMLLPKDIVDAHNAGIIHFHDSDYYIQHMHNCCLVNLEDMLQNGTVISGTLIEKPHSFSTACNIATQIIAQVASNQYGGQSISLAHLAPFVDVSRQKIKKNVLKELALAGTKPTDETVAKIVETRLRDEVRRGIQTIQYQVVTLMTTNGQAPFITVFMYIDEVDDPQTRADLAMIIEETLRQRYQGVKNESGAWVTPAFPKLIYVLDEDNIHEDSPYWYLTVMAAKCTARRMVPDYISAKKMRELKGDVYTCMGCRSFLTPDRFTASGVGNIANAGNYDPDKHKYYGRLTITLGRP